MTPESVLAALVTHSQDMGIGRPDPLVLEASRSKRGKLRPKPWKLIIRNDDGDRIEIYNTGRSAQCAGTFRASTFSLAEVAADALLGMYERNWQALQCALCIGVNVRPQVKDRLIRIAYRLKDSERRWRKGVRRQPCDHGRMAALDYVPDLAELAVRHLEDPYVYQTHRARYEWFGMSKGNWHDVMSRPFDQVAAHLWSWYHQGIGHIQHRIIERGEPLE